MFRMLKWATPLVAVALMLSLSSAVRADEAKKETGSVAGTVLDKDGKAAAGVQVRLFHPYERGQRRGEAAKVEKQNADPAAGAADKPAKEGKRREKGDRPQPVATATTDSDGKFTMNDVPVGKYVVQANLRGQGAAREEIEVTAGGAKSVDLKLKDKPARGERKGEKGASKKEDSAK
ncbi:MAG: Carboxypeptidase regulatory-like domain [Phycisphaerales bacterium]|jgi:hypothetical protein|nr:Carboxypeptidase regulatory-like domain [Phycisphaerales bacterium]